MNTMKLSHILRRLDIVRADGSIHHEGIVALFRTTEPHNVQNENENQHHLLPASHRTMGG